MRTRFRLVITKVPPKNLPSKWFLKKPSEDFPGTYQRNLLKAIIIPICCIATFNLNCKDEPTKPTDIPKNPREYTWTVDTIAFPGSWQTNMQSIWGSSTSDVYIVGHNDQPGPGTMFHYDGKSWSTTKFHSDNGGPISGAVSLKDIYGFGPNDVWVAGLRTDYNPNPPPDYVDISFLLHYDGSQWKEQQIQQGRTLQVVWGIAPDNVWAGGLDGTLYYFNGVQWKTVPMPFKSWFSKIEGTRSTDVYGITYHFSTGVYDTMVWSLLHWDGNDWSLQDRFNDNYYVPDKFGTGAIHVVNGTYYSTGRGYFKKSGDVWQRIYYDENRPNFIDFAALNENDVFVVGNRGAVLHYNGSDWFRFIQFANPDFMYSGCWRTEHEVFIVGNNGNKTIVLHGK